MSRRTLLLWVLLASPALADAGGYLFVAFKNGFTTQSEQIYFGLSQDGSTGPR